MWHKHANKKYTKSTKNKYNNQPITNGTTILCIPNLIQNTPQNRHLYMGCLMYKYEFPEKELLIL